MFLLIPRVLNRIVVSPSRIPTKELLVCRESIPSFWVFLALGFRVLGF